MTGREVYKIWAPEGAKWVEWVRPVPFVAIDNKVNRNDYNEFSIPNKIFLKEYLEDTAIIIDLPEYSSIETGIAFAKLGFRLIPLYNGTSEQEGAIPTTNNHIVESALIWGLKNYKK